MKVDISYDFVLDLRFVNSFHSFNLKLLCILATQNFIVTNIMSAALNFSVCRLILQRLSYRGWHLTDLESRKVVQIHFVKRCTFRDN